MPTFYLSPRAAQEILVISERTGHPTPTLRVSVASGGCSGMSYKFELAGEPEPDDIVVETNGARVVVDNISLEFMDGATLDWEDNLMGSHFKIVNPQATSGCGCGVSFSV